MIKKETSPRNDFLIVHKSVLPRIYNDVITARDMIEYQGVNVSEACKLLKMSRSTYYKYKDLVFMPTSDFGKKMMIAIKMVNVKGTLSNVLQAIANLSGNILSIHQNSTISAYAYATIMIDVIDMSLDFDDFIEKIKQITNVIDVELLAVE